MGSGVLIFLVEGVLIVFSSSAISFIKEEKIDLDAGASLVASPGLGLPAFEAAPAAGAGCAFADWGLSIVSDLAALFCASDLMGSGLEAGLAAGRTFPGSKSPDRDFV